MVVSLSRLRVTAAVWTHGGSYGSTPLGGPVDVIGFCDRSDWPLPSVKAHGVYDLEGAVDDLKELEEWL